MADNAADRKSIRAREKAARLADTQRREVIGQIMSTSPGRAWLWDHLSQCHMFTTTYTSDPHLTAFQEGRRSVGLTLLADIMVHCPDAYIQAMRESNERYIAADTASRRADPADERRSGPVPDGGDSGSIDSADDPDATEGPDFHSTIGADIYAPVAEGPGGKAN